MKKKRTLAFLLIFTILTSLCGCSASAITGREKRTADKLEKATIDTIESGVMTKDLYLISELENKTQVDTTGFLEAIASRM